MQDFTFSNYRQNFWRWQIWVTSRWRRFMYRPRGPSWGSSSFL